MKTTAVRLYGKNDLRLESFELPKISNDEILARVVTDSICMSTHKALIQGEEHKRVPDNIKTNPIIIGHEFCGEIIEVGEKWKGLYKEGDRFVIQPALNYKGSLNAPGYSYEYIGGSAQYIIIPKEVMETDNLIKYYGTSYYAGSLAEPMSCIIGAFNANYHTTRGCYEHRMGVKPNGSMLIMAGCGPMGIGAIDYALNGLENPPRKLIVTDIDDTRLEEAKKIYKKYGDKVLFINSSNKDSLLKINDGYGYDDIFIFAPVKELIELANGLLAEDGCLNFFAGPMNHKFCANVNFYDIHYSSTHIVGTSGGNRDDMINAVQLINSNKINPSAMITHIGGLDSVIATTSNLPNIEGGKKLIYTEIELPLTKITDFEKLSVSDDKNAELFRELDVICKKNNGLWNDKAEAYLLKNRGVNEKR